MSNRRVPLGGSTGGAGTAAPPSQSQPPHSQPPASNNHQMYQQRAYLHNPGAANVRSFSPPESYSSNADQAGQFVLNGHGGIVVSNPSLDPLQGFTTQVPPIASVSASNSPVFAAGPHGPPHQFTTNAPPPVQGNQSRHYYPPQPGQQRMSHQAGGSRMMQACNPRGGTPNGNGPHATQQGLPSQQVYMHQQPVFLTFQPHGGHGFHMGGGQSPQAYQYGGLHSIGNAGQGPPSMIYSHPPYAPFQNFQPYVPPPMVQTPMGLNSNAAAAVAAAAAGTAPPNAAGAPPHLCGQPRPPPPQTPPGVVYGAPNPIVPNSTNGGGGGVGPHSLQMPYPMTSDPMQMYQPASHPNSILRAPATVTPAASVAATTTNTIKRQKKALVITNPETGENVLDSVMKDKLRDEAAKSEAIETTRKDIDGSAAETKEQQKSETTPSTTPQSSSSPSSLPSTSIRDEFQSKVSKAAAESKAEAVKAAAAATTVVKSSSETEEQPPPPSTAAAADDEEEEEETPQLPEATAKQIHSDSKASAKDSSSLRNNSHQGRDELVGAAATAASSSPPEVTTTKKTDDETTTSENRESHKEVHSDQKPDASAEEVERSDRGHRSSPTTTTATTTTTPIKSVGHVDLDLEPISPTPLPETPSTKKDDATTASKHVSSKDAVDAANVPSATATAAAAAAAPVVAVQRPGSKRGSASKRAELNRKGAEKAAGSEMDAFKEVVNKAASAKEEVVRPSEPTTTATTTLTSKASNRIEIGAAASSLISSSTSSLTSSDTSPLNNAPKQRPDVGNSSSSDNRVKDENGSSAAQAVSNGEVSAEVAAVADPPSNNKETPKPKAKTLLENGTPASFATTATPKLLKYEYKEDQWSPVNMDGKKQYDRDFLIQLQRDPMSLTKPQNLPRMDIIKDKAITTKFSPATQPDFMPQFVKTTSSRGTGSMPKNRSRDGKRPQLGGPGGGGGGGVAAPRQIVLSIQEKNVELRTTENAWKCGAQKRTEKGNNDAAGEAALDPEEVVKRGTMSILNKLTPQKFDSLIEKFNQIQIDTAKKLDMCIELIFEKAVDEPGFSKEYAKMCSALSMKHVVEDGSQINFKKILITRCQKEFEKDYMDGISRDKYKQEMREAENEQLRKEIKENFQFKEMRARRRSIGNTRFIGELYKLGMLTVRIMHECIRRLLRQAPDEESLESLCRLLATVGKHLETETDEKMKADEKTEKSSDIFHLQTYFTTIESIIAAKQTSSRVRFLLQDAVDLRKNNWVPRRDVAGPKTIDQIHKDVEQEKKSKQLDVLAYGGGGGSGGGGGGYSSSSRSLGGRENGRDRNQDVRGNKRFPRDGAQGGGGGGWSSKNPPHDKFDPTMLSMLRFSSDRSKDSDLVLDNRGKMKNWGRGSGGHQEGGHQTPLNNRYDLLTRSVSPNERPRSTASRSVSGATMGRGGRGPTAAGAGGERQAALAAAKDVGKSSNGPPFGVDRLSSFGSSRRMMNQAVVVPEVGPSDEEIASHQNSALVGHSFANDEKRLGMRLQSTIMEYCSSQNVEDALKDVKESCTPNNMPFAVETWINLVLERKPGDREKLGNLLVDLVRQKLLTRSQALEGLGTILMAHEDMITDIPKFWEWIGELIVPLLDSGVFVMTMLQTTAKKVSESVCVEAGLYVKAVLRQLEVKVGRSKIVDMWNKSGLDWKQFLPADSLDNFVAEHQLEFIQSASTPSSPDQLRATLDGMLETNTTDKAFFDFFGHYFHRHNKQPAEPDDAFIRVLTTSVTRSCLTTGNQSNQDPSQRKFCKEKFEKRVAILKWVFDAKDTRQKQALYALQALMMELEHPSKMLQDIFEAMSQNDIISEDAFEAWEQCTDPAEQEGKGVAIKSTTQFFTWLREKDSSDDDSAAGGE